MKLHKALVAFLMLVIAACGVHAQPAGDYPNKPVKLIVPFAAGSGSDFLARLVAQHMSGPLGQPVVVENVPGAQGVLGAGNAARALPDGYTLLLGGVSINAANESFFKKLPYDMKKSFDPVSKLGGAPLVLVVANSATAGSTSELIAKVRARPGTFSFASGSASSRVAGEMFKARAGGMDAIHVPYKGSAQALIDLMAGQVNFMIVDLNTCLPHIHSGKLKALAVTGAQRTAFLPDVPTMAEAGVADYELTGWSALYAPAGTPKAVIEKLNSSIRAAAASPDYEASLRKNGFGPAEASSPAELGMFTQTETAKWSASIKAAGILPE